MIIYRLTAVLFFNLNGYLLLMLWMFSLHHDVMVQATREDKLNLAKMELKHSESNMADAYLKSRKVPIAQI